MNEYNKAHIINALKQHVRPDGRKCDEYRNVEIITGVVKTAEGSAKVKIGNTEVIAGVKMAIEKPYPDTSDQGNFMVNVELLPLSNPEFETGAPGNEAIELARVTDRGIRESKAIDSKKLCIEEGKAVWSVGVDICTLNDEGNLFDACSIATVAALKDAKYPHIDTVNGEPKIDYSKKTDKKLPIKNLPVSITIYKIADSLIVDPSSVEEQIYDARLSVAIDEDETLCAMQKGGDGALSVQEIEQMIDLAAKKSKELFKLMK